MLTLGLVILGLIVLIAIAAVIDVLRWTGRRRRGRDAQSAGEAMYQREAQLTKGRQTGLTMIVKQIDERDKQEL
jgi:hypothetical protein